jgi:hypothetical protein
MSEPTILSVVTVSNRLLPSTEISSLTSLIGIQICAGTLVRMILLGTDPMMFPTMNDVCM